MNESTASARRVEVDDIFFLIFFYFCAVTGAIVLRFDEKQGRGEEITFPSETL